jgi:hypothetical protein
MSSTILGGDFTVNYLDESRQAMIEWTGAGLNDTHTANAVYSALMDLFDETGQSDDGVPMSAQTPTEYTIGIVDAGVLDPWYITYDAMEHITGGAIRTASWARVVGSNTGIVVIPVSAYTLTSADIGDDGLNHNVDNDVGTLLEIIDDGGSTAYLVVRPATNAAANSFNQNGNTVRRIHDG